MARCDMIMIKKNCKSQQTQTEISKNAKPLHRNNILALLISAKHRCIKFVLFIHIKSYQRIYITHCISYYIWFTCSVHELMGGGEEAMVVALQSQRLYRRQDFICTLLISTDILLIDLLS